MFHDSRLVFGDVIAECRKLGNKLCEAVVTKQKLEMAGWSRYKSARRVELYRNIIGKEHDAKIASQLDQIGGS